MRKDYWDACPEILRGYLGYMETVKGRSSKTVDEMCIRDRINTITGMRIDIKTRRPILKNNTGGLSGPAVFPVAVRMVREVYKRVNVPIVGMGGISSFEDAVEKMCIRDRSC